MVLSEIGYDHDKHEAGISEIRSQGLSFIETIRALVELYFGLYRVNDYQINCGLCEDFANDVVTLFPEAEALWGDEVIDAGDDPDQYAYHCIIRYEGRYYDSQHIEGVDDFRDISAFNPSIRKANSDLLDKFARPES